MKWGFHEVSLPILWGVGAWMLRQVLHPMPIGVTDIDYVDLLGTEMLPVMVADLDGDGEQRTLSLAERHLLLFVDPTCPLCETIYPAAKAAHAQLPTVLIFPEEVEQVEEYIEVQGLESISAVRDAISLNEQLNLTGIPTALYIEANRIVDIGSGDLFALSVIEGALDNERRRTRYSLVH